MTMGLSGTVGSCGWRDWVKKIGFGAVAFVLDTAISQKRLVAATLPRAWHLSTKIGHLVLIVEKIMLKSFGTVSDVAFAHGKRSGVAGMGRENRKAEWREEGSFA